MKRREMLKLGIQVASVAAAGRFVSRDAHAGTSGRYVAAFALLDSFVERYMREMNAPGMTLSLADADGTQRVCAYGLGDLATRQAVNPDKLFHIGSIS